MKNNEKVEAFSTFLTYFIDKNKNTYGEVAQLARAIGSYPIGREFESHPRYHKRLDI